MEDTSTRGGKRRGAGRPRGIKRPYKKITINMPEEYTNKLKLLAKQKGTSLSKLLQGFIDENLIEEPAEN